MTVLPRGEYFQIRRSGEGGLDLTSSLEAKFGVRSGQVHKIRGKIWDVLSPKDAKVGEKSQFWGHIYPKFRGQNLGYLSFLFLEAKFGAPTRTSEQNLRPSPPDLLIWKYPLGCAGKKANFVYLNTTRVRWACDKGRLIDFVWINVWGRGGGRLAGRRFVA